MRVGVEEASGRTRVTLEQCGLPASATDETREGWRLSWDKLGVLVAEDRAIRKPDLRRPDQDRLK